MPRKDRSETVYDNSTQHITQRGLNRSKIFRDNVDYKVFKDTIRRYLFKYNLKLYNYCFMPNHIHLLVFLDKAPDLSRFMQALSLSYSSYYHKKYKYTGYLWQGRFKNIYVGKDSYLLECARYIDVTP